MSDLYGRAAIVVPIQHIQKWFVQASRDGRYPARVTDPIECDVIILEPVPAGLDMVIKGAPEPGIHRRAIVMAGNFVGRMKNAVGQMVLGTVAGDITQTTSLKWTNLNTDPRAIQLADAWRQSPEGAAYTPSTPGDYSSRAEPRSPQPQQQGGGHYGWPDGAMPANQWQQQQGGYGAPQPPQGPPQQQGWGQQVPQGPPPQQWQQQAPQQQGWGQQTAPQAPPAQQWQPQPPQAPQQPQQAAWGQQRESIPQQPAWGQPQSAWGQQGSQPAESQGSTLDSMRSLMEQGHQGPPPY
jgi:hypothetical protein